MKKVVNNNYTKSTIIISILGVLVSFLMIIMAYATKILVNSAFGQGGFSLIQSVLAYIVLTLLMIVLNSLFMYVSAKNENRIFVDLRRRIYQKLLLGDMLSISNYHSADIINRSTVDVGVYAQCLAYNMPNIASGLVRIILSVALLFVLDWVFGLIVVVSLPVVLLIANIYGKKTGKLHRDFLEMETINKKYVAETVQNITLMRATDNTIEAQTYYENLQRDNFRQRIKLQSISIVASMVLLLAICFVYIFVFYVGASKITMGLISYGEILAILQLILQMQTPIKTLPINIGKYHKMKVSEKRLAEVLSIDDYNNRRVLDGDLEDIQAKNLYFAYGDKQVLNNVSFVINKGDFVGVEGDSGCGKTTLIKLVMGLLLPQQGVVSINGKENKAFDIFSYVPQTNMILSGTIRENITFFNKSIKEDNVWQALKICCLDDVIRSLSNGLDTCLGERGLGLSEGQLQRLAIARALLMNKQVLILDEATSSLDKKTELDVLKQLKALNITVIMVTHHTDVFKLCDYTIKL